MVYAGVINTVHYFEAVNNISKIVTYVANDRFYSTIIYKFFWCLNCADNTNSNEYGVHNFEADIEGQR